jgi:hypothetical protein
MEFWNHIINTSLLGTNKRALKKEEFGVLAESLEPVYQNDADNEEQFLQTASVVYNYRQCGFLPLLKENLVFPKAGKEEKKYCSPGTLAILNDLIQVDSIPLLKLWFNECTQKGLIITPEYIPTVFDLAVKHEQLQDKVLLCTGKRGEWLMQFNDNWKFTTDTLDQNLWQTGTLQQRKRVLEQVRKTGATTARQWLQAVWAQESAATRTELLSSLEINLGKEDEPLLEELLKEKSSKVKEETLRLLQLMPESKLVQEYLAIVRASIELKKEKGVFGIGGKTDLIFHLAEINESIYKTGIEKLSNQKAFSDEEFIFYQLIQHVPPEFWEQHFQLSPPEMISLFQKSKWGVKFLPAFVSSVIKFRNVAWASAFAVKEDSFYNDILEMLPAKEWEEYCLKFVKQYPSEVISSVLKREESLRLDLAKAILKHTAGNGYSYSKAFYNNMVHLLPIEIINELEKCTPAEVYQRDMWTKNSEHIIQLLTLKTQTLQSFQS